MHVEGKVQGVFYRKSTRRKAGELKLRGTVQNLPDGRVRIHAGGDESAIEELIAWCHEGPPAARVTAVIVEEADPPDEADFISIH